MQILVHGLPYSQSIELVTYLASSSATSTPLPEYWLQWFSHRLRLHLLQSIELVTYLAQRLCLHLLQSIHAAQTWLQHVLRMISFGGHSFSSFLGGAYIESWLSLGYGEAMSHYTWMVASGFHVYRFSLPFWQ